MQEIIIRCNHCNKIINKSNAGYEDLELEGPIDYFKGDLCKECAHELNEYMRNFMKITPDNFRL